MLGVSFRDGTGIAKDAAAAVKWLTRAAAAGHARAQDALRDRAAESAAADGMD